MDQFKGLTRLPKFAIPSHYDLHLKLDLTSCTFSGTLRINLHIVKETRFLVLNALELDIGEVFFATNSSAQKRIRPCDVALGEDDEILVLGFDEVLGVGEGVLAVQFSGVLNSQLKGLYRCSYVVGRQEKNMATTQFEAVEARRCFPCWDEPALKATFRITLDVPPELTALSNMPVIEEKLDGNFKTVYFEESPPMSTYLVALVVGLFEHIEDTTVDGVKVRVYCPPGKRNNGKFALHLAVKALELFSEYFSMPYPLPKLDMVAVPEFSGGAMENNGLIIYRENELLHDELLSTAAKKQRLTIVVTHEVAHHWFGNLVTMEWWTHLWLNEGFATWVSYMATDRFFPEWKIWTQFLQQSTGGLHMDALENSHPIEIEVSQARSVLEIFDAISYKKGSAVIRMLQDYLGDKVFQKSLSSYIKRYAWKNAKTEDLWNVLTEETGVKVNAMMNTWTKRKGYPVISVKLKGHILEVEQSPFLSSGSHGEGQWIIPITLCIGSYSRTKKFLLETKVAEVDLCDFFDSSDGQRWVKVNVDQSGFYRVKYEHKLAVELCKAVESNSLTATDKYGILDDAFALCEGCDLPLSSLLTLMDVYKKELDYIVLSKLIDCSEDMPQRDPEFSGQLETILYKSPPVFCQLGWEAKPGESHLDVLSRGEVLMAMANFGDETIHKEALRRFKSLLNDKDTPLRSADTKRAAYISIMRNTTASNRDHFESLLRIYREADTVQERERILRFLAFSPDPDIVLEVLNFLVSDQVRNQDIVYGLAQISLEGRETAWKWFKENWDFILKKYGTGVLLPNFIVGIVSPFSSDEKADEVKEFFAGRMSPAFSMNLEQSIEQVRVKARWVRSIKREKSLEDLIKQLACKG
ncbi:aminopeptidase M1-like [Punica granatum]|uniref:Aminopeptidase n=1 Tax=Punica granatum TaxID=22663 RepID=A0A6P8D5W6_PUNGR|nr:aminopeptidase M1-like [Punica granatum]